MKRDEVYRLVAEKLGEPEYHTANIRTIEEARFVYSTVRDIAHD